MRSLPPTLAALVAAPLMVVGLSTPASAAPADNGNGIIEVDGKSFDTDPGNEPHVGCVFQIDFKNYDEGDTRARVTFELQPPTTEPENRMRVRGALTPFIGDDPAGGQDDIDAQERYVLSFSGPPAAQGYHVKLTVDAAGTTKADKRFKVYYVQCERRFQAPEPAPEPSPAPTVDPAQGETPSGVVPTAINGGATAGDKAPATPAIASDVDGTNTALGLLVVLCTMLMAVAAACLGARGAQRRTDHGS